MQWLIEEVFTPAMAIAESLAGTEAVRIGAVFFECRKAYQRLEAGLKRADKELQKLPQPVADEVRELQRIMNGSVGKISYLGAGVYYANSGLGAAAKRGWEAVLRHTRSLPFPLAGSPDTNDGFVERLLAGPNDVELTPRELALLKAHLNQPISMAQMQREATAEGKSPTAAGRHKLKLIRDFNRNLQTARLTNGPLTPGMAGDANDTPPESTDAPQSATKPKRSTERGEGRAKLIAALTKHHKYADGSCLNLEPIGNNELARIAAVSESTASAFFNKEFAGHTTYRAICGDVARLVTALKLLNQEFSPHHLYGGKPAGEDERDGEG